MTTLSSLTLKNSKRWSPLLTPKKLMNLRNPPVITAQDDEDMSECKVGIED
ncbi:hypothetical protein PF003_g10362 [Phytophthora fragariae]|nr:hypothetical protein PF003_g10362 [Phytophthora fragariae]